MLRTLAALAAQRRAHRVVYNSSSLAGQLAAVAAAWVIGARFPLLPVLGLIIWALAGPRGNVRL